MADPTDPILQEISRSVDEECRGGATLSNWSSKAPDLGFERCGSAGHVNIVAETFSSAWRRVTSPMEAFPLYNDRSGDDLSVSGGLGPSKCLERRFRRSWWRVGG
jgi:hypothetical protein